MAYTFLLDSSAVLALLQAEPGSERVVSILPESAMSAVNAAEVINVLRRRSIPGQEALRSLLSLGIPVLPFDEKLLSPLSDGPGDGGGLSLGDRICLATARQYGLVALTAERQWAKFATSDLKIELLR